MPRVPSAEEAREKWQRVSQTRGRDYESGVRDPGVDWERATAGSRESYEAGVQDAIARGAFTRGVSNAGNEGWRAGVESVGIQRWPQGIAAGGDSYAEGMAPVLQTIERTALPPRRPRGDPQNIQRVAAIAESLTRMRKQG